MKYHKLIRDYIPEIIAESGKVCITEVLSGPDYIVALDAKLEEELNEYRTDHSIEELADLLEVIHACAVAHGYTVEQLEDVRKQKAAKRGAFAKKLLLKEVSE